MCLAIPAKIIKIDKNTAEVENLGVIKKIDISLVPDAKKGDFVIVHAGFAIQIMDRKDAQITQDYWKEFIDESSR